MNMNQQEKENYVLNKLMPQYVSLYRIELNSGKYEILRLAKNTNARVIVENRTSLFPDFDEFTKQYADSFIPKEEQKEFFEWHACKNLKKKLSSEERLTYHYHSISKEGNDSYYEAYAVRGTVTDESFEIFLGYRNIDSILYKERATQEKLQKALDEARLGNEIISSIAKSYQYISRIDIQEDWFEEISNKDKEHLKFENSGIMSEGNKKTCRQFVADEYQEAFFKFTDISTLPDRMKDEETIAMEYKMKDGSWHKLRFIEKKRDADGRLTHVICVIRSISDTKRREQILLDQVAEAKKESALKTKFLSDMSHDIRTPINGIMGMIELANRYPNDQEMQKNCRNKVMESARHLVSLVNDILDMNKLESGDIVEQEVNFNLAELLNRVNTSKQIQAENKKIAYIVDWEKSNLRDIYLAGNPVYLEKMLATVADNAVKFTNPGGSVSVWCAEKSVDHTKAVYEFGCADTGIGMSQEFIGHAFEMFSQENKSSRSRYEGTGLGLAIAKKIADKLGGTIEISSKKGQGTKVVMTVPLKIGEVPKSEKKENHEEVCLDGIRALVAEDNELNMEITKFILEDNGIYTECVSDGLEAVKKFEEMPSGYFDVILMDIMMPNMNGWDATRKIRAMKREDAGNIPIIAMSANTFAEDIINSSISGMNGHLAKPVSVELLINTIRKVLRDRR